MDKSDTDTSMDELVNTTSLAVHSLLTPSKYEVLLLNKLRGLLANIKWSPDDASNLLGALVERFESTTNDRSHLWLLKMLHCIEINFITPTWKCQEKTLVELVRNKTVTDENLRKYLADEPEKQLGEIIEEIRGQKLNQIDDKLLDQVKDVVSSVYEGGSQPSGLKRELLRLCQAAQQATNLRPRLTQMVSWCIMALSNTGRLIQVGTGEGKSCIVAMFAAFRAMRGDKVDILTSSPVLAERDFKKWQNFFKILGISVDCNANKLHADALKKCYRSKVVYGTVEKFAGDWLHQRLERVDIFDERTFQCAIVDEADSLMLDKGLHVVYMGNVMPALQHLNPLLAFIWATVSQYSRIARDYTNKESLVMTVEAEIKDALNFTPCEFSRESKTCYVPGFLSDLVKSKLKVWIKNAFTAQKMTMGHEYVVEKHGIVPVDYSSTGVVENFMKLSDGLQQFLEMKHELKLSDMTAITNYMSNVSLLQKYGSQIFGMSGTLGQQTETETLQKTYGIKTCQIPSFKRRKLFEVEGVIVDDEKEWIDSICNAVTAQIRPTPYRAKRAALVICETIRQAKALLRALGDKVPTQKLYISNNMDNSEVFKELQAGDVIIATNLAGRGADFQVCDQVKAAGGLFVVQTFLSENARVEAQAFGRTARQGSPGSAQLIVCFSHLSEPLKSILNSDCIRSSLENMTHAVRIFRDFYHRSDRDDKSKLLLTLSRILTKTSDPGIKIAKVARDLMASLKLTSFSDCDVPNIKKKEELFDQYLHALDEVYKACDNKPKDSDLSALNEFWGLWLLVDFKETVPVKDLKNKLTKDLKSARQKLGKRESPSSNLHHYMAFGNELRKKGHFAESIKMYTKAIQQDHCWAAIAFYNRAFTSLSQKNEHQDPDCIDRALEDLQHALKSVEFYCEQMEITQRYTKQVGNRSNVSVTRFDTHMAARHKVLLALKKNINEAIKIVDRARDTGRCLKVEETLVYLLVPVLDLMPMVALSVSNLGDPLKLYQRITDSPFDIFNELRCLESLGLTHVYTLDTWFSLSGFFSKISRWFE